MNSLQYIIYNLLCVVNGYKAIHSFRQRTGHICFVTQHANVNNKNQVLTQCRYRPLLTSFRKYSVHLTVPEGIAPLPINVTWLPHVKLHVDEHDGD